MSTEIVMIVDCDDVVIGMRVESTPAKLATVSIVAQIGKAAGLSASNLTIAKEKMKLSDVYEDYDSSNLVLVDRFMREFECLDGTGYKAYQEALAAVKRQASVAIDGMINAINKA